MWKGVERTADDEHKVVEDCWTGRANQRYCYRYWRRRAEDNNTFFALHCKIALGQEEEDENSIFVQNVATQTDSTAFVPSCGTTKCDSA